jgi:hypothetical protein
MTKLTINEVCKLTTMYRQGYYSVPELAKQFNTDIDTVIQIGRGGKSTVYDWNGKALFSGWHIDCEKYCDEHPKKWGSLISHSIE